MRELALYVTHFPCLLFTMKHVFWVHLVGRFWSLSWGGSRALSSPLARVESLPRRSPGGSTQFQHQPTWARLIVGTWTGCVHLLMDAGLSSTIWRLSECQWSPIQEPPIWSIRGLYTLWRRMLPRGYPRTHCWYAGRHSCWGPCLELSHLGHSVNVVVLSNST